MKVTSITTLETHRTQQTGTKQHKMQSYKQQECKEHVSIRRAISLRILSKLKYPPDKTLITFYDIV